jgi:hypothetical protein
MVLKDKQTTFFSKVPSQAEDNFMAVQLDKSNKIGVNKNELKAQTL